MEIYFHTIGTSFSFYVPIPLVESRIGEGGRDANFYCSDSIVSCRYDISIRELSLSLSFISFFDEASFPFSSFPYFELLSNNSKFKRSSLGKFITGSNNFVDCAN